jgi:hypothetical protein
MANEFKVKKGLIVNGSGSTVFDVLGSQGQLFSVTDDLSGSLFSVNDISGIPILEVFSDDTIKMGTFGAEAIIISGSNVSFGINNPTSKLHVYGDLRLNGLLYDSSNFSGNTNQILSSTLTGTSWTSITSVLGYTPENIDNKVNSFTSGSSTNYPTTQAVVDYITNVVNTVTITVELIDDLTVDFYSPKNLKINSTVVIVGTSPVITILVNDNPYTLEDTIIQGSKITVGSNIESVINLMVEYV